MKYALGMEYALGMKLCLGDGVCLGDGIILIGSWRNSSERKMRVSLYDTGFPLPFVIHPPFSS